MFFNLKLNEHTRRWNVLNIGHQIGIVPLQIPLFFKFIIDYFKFRAVIPIVSVLGAVVIFSHDLIVQTDFITARTDRETAGGAAEMSVKNGGIANIAQFACLDQLPLPGEL